MKPPIPYYGAKTRLAPWLASLLPPHRVYLEPFFGSGAVLFAKQPSAHEVVNDLDNNVVTFFRVLRDRPDQLAHACSLTPYARAEYAAADLADPSLDDLERARRFWVRCCQAYNARFGGRTGWSASVRPGSSTAGSARAMLTRLHACAARLHRVVIDCLPAVEVIAKYGTGDAVIYADPPYLASTRRSLTDQRRDADYDHEYATEADHERLAEALHATPAAVLLSGYPSALYERLYAGWQRLEVTVARPSMNQPGRRGAAALEVVWANRQLPTQLIIPTSISGFTEPVSIGFEEMASR